MGNRSFDGTNDVITFGSDGSIDNLNPVNVSMWFKRNETSSFAYLMSKPLGSIDFDSDNSLKIVDEWTNGGANFPIWISVTTFTSTTDLVHVAVTYDNGSTANDPTLYVNGVDDNVTEADTPVGTPDSDAAGTAGIGEHPGDPGFFTDCDILSVCWKEGTEWTTSEVNRAMWWGVAPGGPSTVDVWHPFWTSDLNNKGTATADGSNTGSTMVATIPRVERMWGSMMGCGR